MLTLSPRSVRRPSTNRCRGQAGRRPPASGRAPAPCGDPGPLEHLRKVQHGDRFPLRVHEIPPAADRLAASRDLHRLVLQSGSPALALSFIRPAASSTPGRLVSWVHAKPSCRVYPIRSNRIEKVPTCLEPTDCRALPPTGWSMPRSAKRGHCSWGTRPDLAASRHAALLARSLSVRSDASYPIRSMIRVTAGDVGRRRRGASAGGFSSSGSGAMPSSRSLMMRLARSGQFALPE